MINQNFVILGAIIVVIANINYIIETVKGKVKPNRVSYLLWSLPNFVAFVAELKQGVSLYTSLMTFLLGFLPLTVFIASFVHKKSEWQLIRFDVGCGILSLMGLIFWYITKSGNVAIVFSILADGFATLPTVVKSFNFPETETTFQYFSNSISAFITLLTVKMWNFANIAFPIYILMGTLILSALIHFKLGKVIRTYSHRFVK